METYASFLEEFCHEKEVPEEYSRCLSRMTEMGFTWSDQFYLRLTKHWKNWRFWCIHQPRLNQIVHNVISKRTDGSFRYFCRRVSLYQQPRSHLWFCCCNSSRIPCAVRKTHRLPKWPNFVNIVPFESIVRYLLVSEQDTVRCFRQCSKEATDLFLGVLPTNTQLEREMSIGREETLSYVFFVFEKDTEIIVAAKNGMGSESLKKHFVHGNSLLEHRQIFAERERERKGSDRGRDKLCWTYASNSCFIFSYSSLVRAFSLSLSFWSFARDESKSGRGGGGGI